MGQMVQLAGLQRPLEDGAAIMAGIGTGAATDTPRCVGLFAMRILTPFSDEISMESTEDSSIISMSFFR